MLIFLPMKVEIPIVVGISTCMSRKISCSAELSMEKSFITSGPGQVLDIPA